MENAQLMIPVPVLTTKAGVLPVMEHFYTLQGEGFFTGQAAWFIRLGGCDVGCVWCDVKDSWDASKHPAYTISQIMDLLKADLLLHQGPEKPIVVITGGEPLMHDLTLLTNTLKQAGYRTNIETSGSSPLSGTWDWICLSPKKFKPPIAELASQAHELKVVCYNEHDFKWAEQWATQTGPDCRLYLQAEWSRAATMYPAIIKYIQQNPKWILSLQTHKYLNID